MNLRSVLAQYTTPPFWLSLLWIALATCLDVWIMLINTEWSLAARQLAGLSGSALVMALVWSNIGRLDYRWWLIQVLAASFLRGGLLATLMVQDVSVVWGVVWTAVCSMAWLASTYVLRDRLQSTLALVKLGIVYLLLLRLVSLGAPELIFEEAYYWNYAQHLDYGYLDHPLVTALVIKLTTWLLGNHAFAVRLGAFVCWIVTAWYSYALCRGLFNVRQAWYAVALVSVLPAYFFFGFFMSPDAALTACWAAALYYFYCIAARQQASAWIGLGISLGIGMSSKYTMALLAAGLLFWSIADPLLRVWWRRKEPYLAIAIALALFSPVIVWNLMHDWASFSFQSEERAKSGFVFSTPRFLGNILLFATPVGVLSTVAMVRHYRTCLQALHSRNHWHPAQQRILLQITSLGLAPLLLFALLSIARTSKLNWTGPCWLALIPAFTLLLNRQHYVFSGLLQRCQQAWPWMAASLILLYGAGLHMLSLGYPGVAYPQNTHLIGFASAAAEIERIASTVEQRSKKPVLVVALDRNRIASGMAFYRAQVQQPASTVTQAAYSTSSQNLFGGNGLMYGWWFNPAAQRGKTLMLISDDAKDLHAPRVLQHVESLGPIHPLPTQKFGQATGMLYYCFAYGYHP